MAATAGVRPVGVHGAARPCWKPSPRFSGFWLGFGMGTVRGRQARAHLLPLQEGGRAAFLFRLISFTPVPPGFQISRATTAFLCSDCRPCHLTQGGPQAFKAHRYLRGVFPTAHPAIPQTMSWKSLSSPDGPSVLPALSPELM